jgi:pseudouridine-5'-phosphate glycosidase
MMDQDIALVKNNAQIGARVAVEYAKLVYDTSKNH